MIGSMVSEEMVSEKEIMTDKEFIDKYGQKLNNEQIEAVRAVEGFVLLLAVPGSGKTTVLINRLGYMLYVKEYDLKIYSLLPIPLPQQRIWQDDLNLYLEELPLIYLNLGQLMESATR